MDDNEKRDKGRSLYRQEKQGGIVAVCCGPNGKRLIRAVPSIRAFSNWFEHTRQMKDVPDQLLEDDWNLYGAASFYSEILETLPRSAGQTDEAYAGQLKELLRDVISGLDTDLLY